MHTVYLPLPMKVMGPLFILLGMLCAAETAFAKPKAVKAVNVAGALKLSIKSNDSQVVVYDDYMNQEIARSTTASGKAELLLEDLPALPCRVRVESGGKALVKPVKGATGCKGRDAPPLCQIIRPANDQVIANGATLSFIGDVKRARSAYLRYEWDFGGAADARPTGKETGPVSFNLARDARFWVTFTASDISGARCSDRVLITAGSPPDIPAKVAEQTQVGNGIAGDGYVVLPFTPFSMEFHDLSYKGMPQMYPINWLDAVVLKKGSVGGDKPVFMSQTDVQVRFSAASNPADPVGAGSINSTSQNYPVGSRYAQATIKKSDFYDPCEFTGGNQGVYGEPTERGKLLGTVKGTGHVINSATCSFGQFNQFDPDSDANTFGAYEILPDEGQRYYDGTAYSIWEGEVQTWLGYLQPTGVAMPGIVNPYHANDPQAFNVFDAERNVFEADGIVLFPTDDQGRHNPYPLMRVQAEANGKVLATGDAVVGVSTEFNCADCHSYGKIGADQAFYDQLRQDVANAAEGSELAKYKGFAIKIPTFVKPEDLDAQRKDERDVIEQAAMRNIALLHDFTYSFARGLNDPPSWMSEAAWPGWTIMGRPATNGTQDACGNFCHRSDPKVNENWEPMQADWVSAGGGSCPEYSNSLHNTHGRMLGTLNADYTGSLERLPVSGGFKMADLTQKLDSAHPLLFQVKDAGTPEGSCLFCHQGKRDKYQRDVMAAAGVNCIDCHGDMVVQAGASAMVSRSTSENPPDNNLPIKFDEYPRHPYRDGLPSCASCHTGNGDEPVLRRSYDMTTGKFVILEAKNERFAENLTPKLSSVGGYHPVEVSEDGQACPLGTYTDTLSAGNNVCERGLFRNSVDRHGALPCASCHGPTHATWPNPSPYANDNVTALQLQGHTGTILECNVCHSDDAFKTGAVDGVRYGTGILAGPHNMHPVNDPYWWQDTQGSGHDGGYHNQFAKKPGMGAESDQCAACHGADHKGTRLSKAAVDRRFSNGKGKPVSIKAGQYIGCDVCHSLEQSFQK
ncbi:cytochrome c3 family protein [Methylomonas rhizoryzae]|uniref:cytochrome c3 family protein n=1 Tax=Methylomonas rhizoryzae TaxID=2608981 RepID=UPI00123266C5|nr:cytochrome c3 family protein [Methylomonas rhizoryzae]